MVAVKTVLRAIPGLEVVELDVPVVSTQASHLSVLPKFKAELRACYEPLQAQIDALVARVEILEVTMEVCDRLRPPCLRILL